MIRFEIAKNLKELGVTQKSDGTFILRETYPHNTLDRLEAHKTAMMSYGYMLESCETRWASSDVWFWYQTDLVWLYKEGGTFLSSMMHSVDKLEDELSDLKKRIEKLESYESKSNGTRL